ncbi:adenylate cyclase [Patescibacteria group bacterium]|nr:adenylate cyclase [Patescibacteria group bacterium]
MRIRAKIIISLLFVTMLISGGVTGVSYWLLQKSLLDEFRNHLRNIAHIGTATIDIPAVKRLVEKLNQPLNNSEIKKIEHSSDYYLIDKQLQFIRQSEPKLIQFIYILIPTDNPNNSRFLVDADVLELTAKQANGEKVTEEDISHFGLEYDISNIESIKQTFLTQTLVVENELVADPVYHTRSLSAYAPLFDEKNKLIGLLGVDLKDEDMAAALKRSQVISAALVLSALLFAMLLSIFLGHQLTRGIRMLNQVVSRFASREFEVRAPIVSTDEVGNLSYSFNLMAETIDEYAKHLEALLVAYGRFVPHSFLELLQKDSIIDLQLGDHVQQEMTVLFADIRSFTSLSESMTPKENFDFVNAFLHRVGPVIRTHGGVIDKYIGDAVMALFPNSPDQAVAAAIDMQHKVAEYNQHRIQHGWQPIAIGIGLHTGSLILGTVGESERMNSTVIADAVNLASRLESATKYYGAGIIVSEQTLDKLNNNDIKMRFLDKVQVKGKQQMVAIYQIIDITDVIYSWQTDELTHWQTAIQCYFNRQFSDALTLFQSVWQQYPMDKTAELYVERSQQFLNQDLANDWQGVAVMESK